MIFLAGGTGFIGIHILELLLEKELRVRVTFRSAKKKEAAISYLKDNESSLDLNLIEWAALDLLDPIAIYESLKGCSKVINASGFVSFDDADAKCLFKSNVITTRNLINGSLSNSIKGFIHLGSIAVLNDLGDKKVYDESCEWSNEVYASSYAKYKYNAELEVWRGAVEGLAVVVLLPSVVLGWINGSSKSESIVHYALSKKAKATTGGSGFVAATDVAKAVEILLDKPFTGQRYILNAENMSYERLINSIRSAFKLNEVKVLSRKKLIQFSWLSQIKKLWNGKTINRKQAESWSRQSYYSAEKFEKEFGFKFKPIVEVIDAIRPKIQ